MKGENFTLQLIIIPFDTPIGIRKGEKMIWIAILRVFVFLLKQLFTHVMFQQSNLLLTCDAKVWRDIRCVDMRLNQALTEGVKCGDVRPREQNPLAFKCSDLPVNVGIIAALCGDMADFFVECGLNALAHF